VAAGPRKLISVVVPAYNEEETIETAHQRLSDVFAGLKDRYELELIFTDNHSTDRTFAIITELAHSDPRVRGVRFARNFGFHRSVLTGYRLANGNAAIQIDCDLQDPPEVIPELLEKWEAGHDLVIGTRRTRNDGQGLQFARRLFYRLLSALSDEHVAMNSGDFRLLDRGMLEQLQRIDDAVPYMRGLSSLLARNPASVPYDRHVRTAGESKFSLRRLVSLALDGILAHSTKPLRLASYFGVATAAVTALLSVFYIFGRLFFSNEAPDGFTTLTVLLLFSISLNGIFLGIIGEYIGRIYNQVRRRPTTVIERGVNVDLRRAQGAAAAADGAGSPTLRP
jgi:glycosyltransferase involved in cell wall biosynthesis